MFHSLKSKEIENIFEIKKIFEEDGKKYIFFTKDVPEGRNSRKEFVRLSGLVGLTAWQTMPEEEKITIHEMEFDELIRFVNECDTFRGMQSQGDFIRAKYDETERERLKKLFYG